MDELFVKLKSPFIEIILPFSCTPYWQFFKPLLDSLPKGRRGRFWFFPLNFKVWFSKTASYSSGHFVLRQNSDFGLYLRKY